MKKKMNSLFKKLIACISCMVMAFSMVGTTAFAAMEDETRIIDSEALMDTTLDFGQIELTPVDSLDSINATSMYLGHFQFNGTNWGNWRTIGDGTPTHVRMCIAFKPIDQYPYSTELFVDLHQYSSVYRGSLHGATWMTTPDADGYYFFVSPYFDISQFSDCRMYYMATSSGTTFHARTVDVHAWYDYY